MTDPNTVAPPAARPIAGDPWTWYVDVVRAHSDVDGPFDADSPRWVDPATLLGDGSTSLPVLHQHLIDHDRTPPATAAMYLAGWFAGYTAEVVGLGLATERAGFLVDPSQLRWHLHADGWPERIELGNVDVLVPPGHRWIGRTGVVEVESFDVVLRQTVDRLVWAVTPIIDGCHGLARVGLTGLWNEVGDGLVMVLRHFNELDVDDAMLDAANAAAHLDGVPWRAHAELRIVETTWGRAGVGRKGGCCLAYRRQYDAHHEPDDDSDQDIVEFRRRFPVTGDEAQYCGTCSFRERDDAEARQLFWFELARRRRTINTSDLPN